MLVGALACASPPDPPLELELEPDTPRLFVEATPNLTTQELFGALRSLGVDVWIAADMRLGVRVHEASRFNAACVLLTNLAYPIESLDLAYLPIDDLEPLTWLRSTERLDLTGTRADLQALRHLGELRSLSLAHTDLDSLAPLVELDRLERLDLSAARVDLTAVGQLGSLRELDLRAARTAPRGFKVRDGDGLELGELRRTALVRLDLSQTKVRDWHALAELRTLRHLDLSYTNFSELLFLASLDELETLSLRRTAVADLVVLDAVNLGALRVVDLRDCELVDDAAIDWLAVRRPELEILR